MILQENGSDRTGQLWAELAEPPVGQISMLLFHFGDHEASQGTGKTPGGTASACSEAPTWDGGERLGGRTVGVRQSRRAGCTNSQLYGFGYVI